MYGKIFDSMYDGSLLGRWEAIVTFQQMICLANVDGVVDMTPPAISARTSIPLDIIEKGIAVLSQPDEYSRTPGSEGRRIELIDAHRHWGWFIINYAKYRDLATAAGKREADRIRIAAKRANVATSRKVSQVSQDVADVAYVDVDVDAKVKPIVGQTPPDDAPPTLKGLNGKPQPRQQAREILAFLNAKTGHDYHPVDANINLIVARLGEGATEQDLRSVIAMKIREWRGDEKMMKFLRPATLFSKTNFAQYHGQLIRIPEGQASA